MADKTKMNKLKKDPELYYYLNSKSEKLYAFRHRFYDALGNRKEKSKQGFKTENEAYRALLEVRTQIINGDTKHVSNDNLTVSEWLDIWYESNQVVWKISTRLQRADAIRVHLKSILGKYKLATLDKNTYKRVFINKLLETHKGSTVQNLHNLFKIAVNAAVDEEIIPRNRFNKIIIPDDKLGDNFYTPSELVQFLKIAEKEENITNYTAILLLAYSGLRKGEAFGLKWKDIDELEETLIIERTRDGYGVRAPKTKNSYRSVIIDEVVIKQLKLYKKWCRETRMKFGLPFNDDTYVFINRRTGLEVSAEILNHSLKRIAERYEIKRISPHGLRHTHATILIQQRTPVKTIAERLGNTPDMIYKIYGHNFEELEREAVLDFGTALNVV